MQLRRIEARRKRAILVIAADLTHKFSSLTSEDLLAIGDQLSNLSGDAIDLILETPGGSGEAAEDIVSLVRRRYNSMGIIVPGTAKSAGTILAMAGDEILMGHESALGPIDAQIPQKGKVFSADALLQGMEQIKTEIVDTGQLNKAYIPMLQNISPGELEHARNAQAFAKDLVRDWLAHFKFKEWTTHRTTGAPVTSDERAKLADDIAAALSDHGRWKTHGRSIKIDNLQDLGLRITNFDDLDWDLRDAIRRYYVLLRMTFETNIYKLFETTTSQIMRTENLVQMPSPPQLQQAMAVMELTCKKCKTKSKVQGNFGVPGPLQPGHQPFPADNKLQCPGCGVEHDLTQARQQLEGQSGKKLLTPAPAP